MTASPSQTGYQRFSPTVARCVLLGVALFTLFCVTVTLSPIKSGFADAPSRGTSDIDLYRAEVRRIRAGQGYYSASHDELVARGYPTRSIFNWRTPLPIWLLGKLPHALIGKGLLCSLAIVGLFMAFLLTAREGSLAQACCCGLLMFGGWLPCFLDENHVMPMLWAGVFIGLSLLAYAWDRQALGLIVGLMALFLRELAAPYCVLCLVLALRQKRYKQAVAWLVGFALYSVFFVCHASEASRFIGPESVAHDAGWVRLGGAAFVISTVQMNCYLLLLPQWVTAIYFSLAMLGLAGWQTPAGERVGLTTAMYVALLGVVGQPFNQYWGLLIVAPCCLGVVRSAVSLRDLWRAATSASWRQTSRSAA